MIGPITWRINVLYESRMKWTWQVSCWRGKFLRRTHSGTPSTIIYTRWSSRCYELGCDAPVPEGTPTTSPRSQINTNFQFDFAIKYVTNSKYGPSTIKKSTHTIKYLFNSCMTTYVHVDTTSWIFRQLVDTKPCGFVLKWAGTRWSIAIFSTKLLNRWQSAHGLRAVHFGHTAISFHLPVSSGWITPFWSLFVSILDDSPSWTCMIFAILTAAKARQRRCLLCRTKPQRSGLTNVWQKLCHKSTSLVVRYTTCASCVCKCNI